MGNPWSPAEWLGTRCHAQHRKLGVAATLEITHRKIKRKYPLGPTLTCTPFPFRPNHAC